MDGAQVRVLEDADEVGLACLLQGKGGGACDPSLNTFIFPFLWPFIFQDLPVETEKGELSDQQVSGLLVLLDLAEGLRSRAEFVGRPIFALCPCRLAFLGGLGLGLLAAAARCLTARGLASREAAPPSGGRRIGCLRHCSGTLKLFVWWFGGVETGRIRVEANVYRWSKIFCVGVVSRNNIFVIK